MCANAKLMSFASVCMCFCISLTSLNIWIPNQMHKSILYSHWVDELWTKWLDSVVWINFHFAIKWWCTRVATLPSERRKQFVCGPVSILLPKHGHLILKKPSRKGESKLLNCHSSPSFLLLFAFNATHSREMNSKSFYFLILSADYTIFNAVSWNSISASASCQVSTVAAFCVLLPSKLLWRWKRKHVGSRYSVYSEARLCFVARVDADYVEFNLNFDLITHVVYAPFVIEWNPILFSSLPAIVSPFGWSWNW